MSIVSEMEVKVLSYLREHSGNDNRVIFNIEDLCKNFSADLKSIEEALLTLSWKGYIKFIKAPLSEESIDLVRKEIYRLDMSYLTGEIDFKKYISDFNQIISIFEDSDVKDIFKPLPQRSLIEIIEGIENVLNYMEKLSKREDVDNALFEKLMLSYIDDLMNIMDLIERFLDALIFSSKYLGEEIDACIENLNVIKLDEKIRNIDRSGEKKSIVERINKLKNMLKKLLNHVKITQNFKEMEELHLKLKEIDNRIKVLKEEIEVIDARILIEGEKKLYDEKNRLRNEVIRLLRGKEGIKKSIEDLRKKAGETIVKKLEGISHRLMSSSVEFKVKSSEKVLGEIKRILGEIERKSNSINNLVAYINEKINIKVSLE